VVILFLLATITVRTAWLLEASSAFKPLRRRIKGKQSEAVAAVTSVDYVPDSQTPQTVAENGAGSGATNRQSGVATRTGS